MITTINQILKQSWSNSNCLYLARNLSVRFAVKTLGNSQPNWSWQNLTVSMIFVLKSFMKNLLMTIIFGSLLDIRENAPFLAHHVVIILKSRRCVLSPP